MAGAEIKESTMDDGAAPVSWEQWYREHAARLLLFARSQTRCEADAQDVLQEAVIKAWRGASGGDHPGVPPLPHVFRAIRSCAIDLGRSIDRRAQRELRAAVDWFEPMAEGPHGVADESFLPGQLEAALDTLPDGQREVLVLKIWGGLTFRQVGEALGIMPETAASRYRYALARLRRRFAGAEEEPSDKGGFFEQRDEP